MLWEHGSENAEYRCAGEAGCGFSAGVLPASGLFAVADELVDGSEAGFDFVGGSRVVGANGHVLCDFGTEAYSTVVEVPMHRVVASEVDYLRHLRPELYA